MRVLLIGPYPPPYGGVQTHMVALREFIRGQGIESQVINITATRRSPEDGVYYPESAAQVLGLLHKLEFDVVHAHIGGNLTPRLLALLALLSALPRARSILTFHSGGYPSSAAGKKATAASLTGLVLRRLDAVVAVNGELVELFSRFGVESDRNHLIPPFSASGQRCSSPDEWPSSIRSFADAHDPLLVSVGLLEPEYDLALQINAVGHLRKRFEHAGLLIIGSGSRDAELRELVAEQQFREHVLMTGDLAHPLTLGMIARADVLLRTTQYDGDALSVREALRLGTPVVATDNGMRPAGVHLFPTGNGAALVDAITGVLRLDADSRANPHHTTEDDGDVNLRAVLRLYEQLVRTSPS